MASSSSSEPISEPISESEKSHRAMASQLKGFLSNVDKYDPTIPEAVSLYYMQKAGVEVGDPKMTKLVSLATDHFLANTLYESHQLMLLKRPPKRENTASKKKQRKDENILKQEDLMKALEEQNINLLRSKNK